MISNRNDGSTNTTCDLSDNETSKCDIDGASGDRIDFEPTTFSTCHLKQIL